MLRFVLTRAGVGFAVALLCVPIFLYAQSASELRGKISTQQTEIEALEEEIRQYTKQLTAIGQEKQTLKSAVEELDVSSRKVAASITLAQKQINRINATIQELSGDISSKEELIAGNQKALAETIRRIDIQESASLLETLLGTDDISTLWSDIDTVQQFQLVVRDSVKTLAAQKDELHNVVDQEEAARGELLAQRTELANQKRALDINRSAKNTLLKETSNRESTYQELLAAKEKEKDEFEAQLRAFQEQLQYILDPSKLPTAGQGVLKWPLSSVTVTQYFGNTAFSQSGAYSGKGHNGIDFRAAPGTPVHSALAGEVWETNEGVARNCQYGKWVLVKHANGLATLYAHLSEISTSKGAVVATGQTIGYSGSTGYSTGPHLHFTVYAADAVSFKQYTCNSGATVAIPIAAYNAYLNPLDYLK